MGIKITLDRHGGTHKTIEIASPTYNEYVLINIIDSVMAVLVQISISDRKG